MHASAVLACVAGGLISDGNIFQSARVARVTRIQARAVWDLLIFILNGVILILIWSSARAAASGGAIWKLGLVLLAGAARKLSLPSSCGDCGFRRAVLPRRR